MGSGIGGLRPPFLVLRAPPRRVGHRQSREFAAAVAAAGKPVQFIVGENYNHFELIETLGNPHGLLGRAALEQMKL
jgi:acetyl esterase/lipase